MATPEERSKHELDAPPWHRVESTLMSTARAIRRLYDNRLTDLGLNLTQAILLAFLAETGPISQSRLASRLTLGRAATGLVIDSLEKRGLIERRSNPDDRRAWLISLLPEGVDLIAPIAGIDSNLRSQLRSGISHPERQRLADLLLRLEANLTEVLTGTTD